MIEAERHDGYMEYKRPRQNWREKEQTRQMSAIEATRYGISAGKEEEEEGCE